MRDYYLSGVGALLLSLIIGKFYIPMVAKKEIGQSIRKDGPKSHLNKEGTPTMGGVIFIVASIVSTLALIGVSPKVNIVLLSMVGFGLVGLIDDGLIIIYNRNEGLSPRQKMLGQLIVSLIIIFLSTKHTSTRDIIIPFSHMKTFSLGILHFPVLLFILLGTVNSVNLTDGLDGLASIVSIIVLFGFAVLSTLVEEPELAQYNITLAGALIGFLYYNKYPAKIFMGDVGSLALGGAIGAVAIMTATELFLPIVGFIYVVETLSVIIQVVHYKRTKRRIFLMSPLHHHYEQKGWHETKVVRIFSVIGVLTMILGVVGVI